MQNRLVSVIVVTFNSSPFIIETLESISQQTWKEIELIITDDCSGDNTVELCHIWLKENIKRFVHADILTSTENTGVSANANRGLFCSSGNWIKFLGADDTLKTNCIEDNMFWIASHIEVGVLFSRIEVYRDSFDSHNLLKTTPGIPLDPADIMILGRSAKSQYRMLLLSDRINFSPSVFINRDILLSVGGFDERFKLLEDYPLWLNLTAKGHKLFFMEKVTVNYRQHVNAINNIGLDYLINPNFFKSEVFRKVYTYPYLPVDIKLKQQFNWYASQIFRYNWLNRNKKPNKFLLALLTVYLNPFKYLIYLKKILRKDIEQKEFYELS